MENSSKAKIIKEHKLKMKKLLHKISGLDVLSLYFIQLIKVDNPNIDKLFKTIEN